ncbi:MAG: hypothetical protein IPH40_04775 [Polaromonas sp.]|nr:hypothetical protein [Polaromonas sp.]
MVDDFRTSASNVSETVQAVRACQKDTSLATKSQICGICLHLAAVGGDP